MHCSGRSVASTLAEVERVAGGLHMSLSDRLQRARTQQLIESGLLSPPAVDDRDDDTVVDVVDDPLVVDEPGSGLFAPVTIEARPIGLHLVAQTRSDLTELPDDENSSTCPTCNARGQVDMVDLVGHTVHYTCATCSTMWQVRKAVVSERDLPSR